MAKNWKKNKVDTCAYCEKPFEHYTWDNQQFCSKECHYQKLKIHTECSSCGKPIAKPKSYIGRNSENYCDRTCYNNRKSANLKRIKRHTSYFTELVNKGCACGVTEYYLLQVHHKDGNVNNNHPSNHEVVCANCHIKRHLRVNKKGKLVYHTKTLTSPETLQILNPLKLVSNG